MEDINKRHCCEIGCQNEATKTIRYSDQIEDYSEFCDDHIVQNLSSNSANQVEPLND